jgi:hypothetical protein
MTEISVYPSGSTLQKDPCVDLKTNKSADPQSVKAVLAVALYVTVTRARCIADTKNNQGDDAVELLKAQLVTDLNTVSPLAGGSPDIGALVDYVADPDNQSVLTELAALIASSKMIPGWGGHQHPTLSELKVALF